MKAGDIVKIKDGSWSMEYRGDSKPVGHTKGNITIRRAYLVLATGSQYVFPVDNSISFDARTDTMVCDPDNPAHIIFTNSAFCVPANRTTTLIDRINNANLNEPDEVRAILREIASK